jgi:hypothetical protein
VQNPCDVPPEIEGRIPPHLKKGLTALLSHEAKILEQLNSNPQLAQAFITNPAGALAKMGVPVDPQLLKALGGAAGRPNPFTAKTYKLPDGSSITPSIKFTFAKHTPSKSG